MTSGERNILLQELKTINKKNRETIDSVSNGIERLEYVIDNNDKIYDELDKEFDRITGLDKTEIGFMLFAAMLQSTRWIMMPGLKIPQMENLDLSVPIEERLGPNEKNHQGGIYDGFSSGAQYEQESRKKYKNRYVEKAKQAEDEFYSKKNNYKNWREIVDQNVPFDAMNALDKDLIPDVAGLNKKGKNGKYNNISGLNHHAATLGHDPILGFVFGTLNILTDTITYSNFKTYDVVRGHKIKALNQFQIIRELQPTDLVVDYSKPRLLIDVLLEAILCVKEDPKRLAAAVYKEAEHLVSDKYCKQGLPIPILSIVDSQKAQELIEKGWNSEEFKKLAKSDLKQITISAGIAFLINLIVEALYMFCIKSDEKKEIRQVKAKKITASASAIALSSNVLYVTIAKDYKKIDIAGMGYTMIKLLRTNDFISKIKVEFIKSGFEELIFNDEVI